MPLALHLQESPIEGLVYRIVSGVHARDISAQKDSPCFDWRPIGVIIAKVVKSLPAMISSPVSNCSFSKLVMLLVTFFTSAQFTRSGWYTYETRNCWGWGGRFTLYNTALFGPYNTLGVADLPQSFFLFSWTPGWSDLLKKWAYN